MTIDKTIEILQSRIDPFAMPQDRDFQDAQKLGIEALKRLKELRDIGSMSSGIPLPGED